jgi:hypothetical protein
MQESSASSATSNSAPPEITMVDVMSRLDKFADAFLALGAKVSSLDAKVEAKSFSEVEALRSPLLDVGSEFKSRANQRSDRQSLGSFRSLDQQDVVKVVKSSFRLDKPKFESPSDAKNDGAFDESVLKFIEECDRHIEIWLHLPENKDKQFEGSEVFALVSLPASVQKRVAHNLDMIYEKSEIVGWSLQQIQQAVYWNRATTETVKRAILIRKAQGVARKDSVKSIQPPAIAWPNGVGFIHLDAFEEYKSKLTTQVSRLADGGVSLSFIAIKDAIISAIPDRDFKVELYAQFGHSGSLPGPNASGASQDFSMKDIFDFIRAHIVVIKKKGLADTVNKNSGVSFHTPPTVRKFGSQGPPSRFPARAVHAIESSSAFPDSDRAYWESGYHHGRAAAEDDESGYSHGRAAKEDDEYTFINQTVQEAKSKECRHIGIGPDGKLLCPYLGNPESAKCGFRHPTKDMELKGKGVSKSVPAKPLKVHVTEGLGISYADESEFQPEDGVSGAYL